MLNTTALVGLVDMRDQIIKILKSKIRTAQIADDIEPHVINAEAVADEICALSPSATGAAEPVALADHDEIGRKILNQPWDIQRAIVTIAAHCTVLTDQFPTGSVADLAGCISQGCLELANALATPPVRGDRELLEQCAKIARQFELDMSGSQLDDRDIENIQHGANVASNAIADAILSLRVQPGAGERPFQKRVLAWMMECYSMEICRDGAERNHRFLEESLELVQSLGCTASESHQLVDYVFGRPSGEPTQELGGVMVTIAALCFPNDLDMNAAAETELARVWKSIDKIRAKQQAKPKHSPLPELSRQPPQSSREDLDSTT